jgi:hypothetical protein
MQDAIVIILVAACFLWLAYLGYRYLRPKPNSSACPGGCCGTSPDPQSPPPSRTQMVSSDDLRARLKARKS